MKNNIYSFLKNNHRNSLSFWISFTDVELGKIAIQDHCDIIYSLYLIGDLNKIDHRSIKYFASYLDEVGFPGWKHKKNNTNQNISVHNFAYLLGSFNLIKKVTNVDAFSSLFESRVYHESDLFKLGTSIPAFPKKLSYHNWRISHWLGGVPSILWSLGNSSIKEAEAFKEKARKSLIDVMEHAVDEKTGLIRIYRFEWVYTVFNLFYKLRHNPRFGEIGGIAHVIWINYIIDVGIRGVEELKRESISLFLEHVDYMESVPYCLDFDIVQAARITHNKGEPFSFELIERASKMMNDIEGFLSDNLLKDYGLHKLPGALAAYHECALICGIKKLSKLETRTKDIIRDAHWL